MKNERADQEKVERARIADEKWKEADLRKAYAKRKSKAAEKK